MFKGQKHLSKDRKPLYKSYRYMFEALKQKTYLEAKENYIYNKKIKGYG